MDSEYSNSSRERLGKITKKKLTTAFIGSISAFETKFGFLWGHNEEDPTPEQLAMRPLWEEVRTFILNNGNNQIRALEQELTQYTVTWNRYRMTLPVRNLKEEKGDEGS